jgi:hypothetical protein
MKKAQIVDLFGRILLVILLALALLAVDMAFAWAAPAGEKKATPGGVASGAGGGAVSGYPTPCNGFRLTRPTITCPKISSSKARGGDRRSG